MALVYQVPSFSNIADDPTRLGLVQDFPDNIEPHEAVPEVSKGKVHITQNKQAPIEWFVTTASQSRI